MYGNFTWWQGVVEDRNDPLKLGRCRVRVFGYHVDDLDEIPTEELPWATPMQPITSAAMNGIGTTPMGPVEGTWVFGFWRDGSNAQEPVIIGTVGGKTEADHKNDPSRGFNDPDGIYPRSEFIGEADTNRLARGIGKPTVGSMNGENAQSLVHKRGSRRRGNPLTGSGITNTGVPKAVAGSLWNTETAKKHETIEDTADSRPVGDRGLSGHWSGDANHYLNDYWNEPNPRYGGIEDSDTKYLSSVTNTSQYPYNHVRMSEGGHVEEWDDSTSAERLHRYHRKGTFEEIQPDGSRVVKVVANDYEIVAGSKNVSIEGICNVTVNGDARVLYRGDLVQEVVGDYHLHVAGEMRTKIIGNDTKEVHKNRKIVINLNDDLFVGENQTIFIGNNKDITVGGNLIDIVKKNVDENYGNHGEVIGNHTTLVYGSSMISNVTGKYTLTVKDDMKISTTADCHHNVSGNYTQTITGWSAKSIGSFSTHDIGSYWTVDTGGTIDITAGGDITVTGGPNIKLNP